MIPYTNRQSGMYSAVFLTIFTCFPAQYIYKTILSFCICNKLNLSCSVPSTNTDYTPSIIYADIHYP